MAARNTVSSERPQGQEHAADLHHFLKEDPTPIGNTGRTVAPACLFLKESMVVPVTVTLQMV